MTISALKRLSVSSLRGATNGVTLNFAKGKKITVVYGENGSGKSTICDAFDLLGNEKVGSLEDRGLGVHKKYWPSVGSSASSVRVELEAADGICTASLSGASIIVSPANLRPRVQILRRKQLSTLLEAQASERYKTVEGFVDVAAFEKSEEALRRLVADLNAGRDTAARLISESEELLDASWKAAGSPNGGFLVWAERALALPLDRARIEREALEALESKAIALDSLESRSSLALARQAAASAKFEVAREEVEKSASAIAGGSLDLLEMLQSAERHLEIESPLKSCPLCESKDRVDGLLERTKERIIGLRRLKAVSESLTDAKRLDEEAQLHIRGLESEFVDEMAAFEKALGSEGLPASVRSAVPPRPGSLKDLTAWSKALKELRPAWVTEARQRSEQIGLHATLSKALNQHKSKVAEQQALDLLLPKAEQALTILMDQRRQFVDSALSSIALKVEQLYELVHPGEGLGKIAMELDPKRRASLDVSVKFAGQDAPAAAYFSQSHVDTLGLCIFLALAKSSAPAESILVLDDVLASVDEPHVDRLVQMLYAESAEFRHCVLTTHYEPWRVKFAWGLLTESDCHLLELLPWSLSTGLAVTGSSTAGERLRTALGAVPIDTQVIASKAGVALEAILDFLSLKYELKVPRRTKAGFTLGDLFGAVETKLRKALRVEVLAAGADGVDAYRVEMLGERLAELQEIASTRNLMGAHFSELGMKLPPSDAKSFGEKVLELLEILSHPEDGWPKSKKSGSYWANSTESRRLHPLLAPE